MCHVPGPRGKSLGYFCPSRASSQCFSQASGASRSQHRLSSFLLTKDGSRGCNAVGCANTNEHRPTNTRNSFSAPEAVLSEVEQRFGCVQAQTHMYPSLVGGFQSARETLHTSSRGPDYCIISLAELKARLPNRIYIPITSKSLVNLD